MQPAFEQERTSPLEFEAVKGCERGIVETKAYIYQEM